MPEISWEYIGLLRHYYEYEIERLKQEIKAKQQQLELLNKVILDNEDQ